MEKTILKLHPNGDFETVDTQLVTLDSHNLFDTSTAIQGYLYTASGIPTGRTGNMESYSAPIPVTQGKYTLQVWWDQPSVPVVAFSNIIIFTANSYFVWSNKVETVGLTYYTVTVDVPEHATFVRISVSHFDTIAKVQLTKGEVKLPYKPSKRDMLASNKPLYSFNENEIIVPNIVKYDSVGMPTWVRDTGQPISFFKEGIVIKGEVIQTNGSLIFSDDFNRPDSNVLGGKWIIPEGNYIIKNNTASPTNVNTVNNLAIVDVGLSDNIRITLGVIVPMTSESLVFRCKDANNYYHALIENRDLYLRYKINGVSGSLGELEVLNAVRGQAYKLSVELRGQHIKVFVNDDLMMDGNLPTSELTNETKHGMKAWSNYGTLGYFDNFKVEKLV